MNYVTDIVELPEPQPEGLPDNFGERVWLSRRVSPTGYECYGFIIADINEMVEIAYYQNRHQQYSVGFFQKCDLVMNPLGRKPVTYQQVIDGGIEVWS